MQAQQHTPVPFGTMPDGPVIDAGVMPSAARVAALVAAGEPVRVTLRAESEEDPGMLAAASVYAWLGVRLFLTPPASVPALRQVLDMVSAIQGTTQPVLSRRGLA
ncbi:hypothetical protein [Actinomadura hibisca]|uniref:hypothetical protein n=1 Tax=Actinomadura hibisca TaxID=68565 RepID=UPI001FDF4DF4|nr:hypothetical protein [Actinomadura hibisca]